MSSNEQRGASRALTEQEERRQRYRDFREYQRGKRDGQSGYSLSGLSEVYIEGYILGRKLAFKIVAQDH